MQIHLHKLVLFSNLLFSLSVSQDAPADDSISEDSITGAPSTSTSKVDTSSWPLCVDVLPKNKITDGQLSCLTTAAEVLPDPSVSDVSPFSASCRDDGPPLSIESAENLCDKAPLKHNLPPSAGDRQCTCEVWWRNEAALAFCNCDPRSSVDGKPRNICKNRRKKCVNANKKSGAGLGRGDPVHIYHSTTGKAMTIFRYMLKLALVSLQVNLETISYEIRIVVMVGGNQYSTGLGGSQEAILMSWRALFPDLCEACCPYMKRCGNQRR